VTSKILEDKENYFNFDLETLPGGWANFVNSKSYRNLQAIL